MHIVQGKNINEIVYNLLDKIVLTGHRAESRNGDVLAIYDTEIILDNPRSRHLNLIGRTNNIFATIAETFWVLSGDNKINPYLSFFIPRASQYSDDSETWRGAYGERLYSYGQLDNIIEIFQEEGIYSRRAVMSLYMPNKDSKESLQKKYGINKTKDIPCNNWINLFITPDKSLNMKVTQRSGDIIFGVSNINIFEFTVLQEMILDVLKRNVDNDLTLGYYHHSITNLHLYDFNGEQGYKILENKLKHPFGRTNSNKLYFAETIKLNKEFFSVLVKQFGIYINEDSTDGKKSIEDIAQIFDAYNIQTTNNLLWGYALVVLAFIFHKKFNVSINIDISNYCNDFKEAIYKNHFNKMIKANEE